MDRRTFLSTSGSSLGAAWLGSGAIRLPRFADLPKPTPSQLAWQRDELAMFLHFGVNTFTNREWGDGKEDPAIFAPSQLDARQWARTAKAAGFRAMILTAKHHDGFCLWPTATTKHSVASSPFRGGNGDVVREMVDACRAEGLKAGLYLSPWDRNNPAYGDSPRYNDLYADQLTELLTRYGDINEVWFDGANGEGPNGKRQVYDWPRVWGLVRKLQPNAVMFSDAGPDVRWCGNENGSGGEPNWSMVNPAKVTFPGMDAPGVTAALQNGDRDGTVWRPAEADTSIRPGWFYHPADDAKVRSVDNLYDLYFKSVGRNAKLLLNVPPTRDGLLHATDVERLTGMRARLDALNASKLAVSGKRVRAAEAKTSLELSVTLAATTPVSVVRLAEPIEHGQRVAKHVVYGSPTETGDDWKELARGTTIGYARLAKFESTPVRRVKLVIEEAVERPELPTLELYSG